MVAATQCVSVTVSFWRLTQSHSHVDTDTPSFVACVSLCLGGCTQSQAHRHTTLCGSVGTACERVRDCDYVIVAAHTVSVTPIAVWLRGCYCAHDAQSQSQSDTHANSVTQCVTQCVTVSHCV